MLHGPATFYPSIPGLVPMAPPRQKAQTSRGYRQMFATMPPNLPSVPGTGIAGLADDASMIDPVTSFLLAYPTPSSTDIVNFLKPYEPADRALYGQQLIDKGVPSTKVSAALSWLDTTTRWRGALGAIGGVAALASAAASGYHGYRRNNSIWWGAVWFAAGTVFPIFTPVIAIAQGFGKRKEHS